MRNIHLSHLKSRRTAEDIVGNIFGMFLNGNVKYDMKILFIFYDD